MSSQDDVLKGTHKSKPAPDKLNCLMQQFGAEQSNTIMIGDTISDIKAAHNAGVKSIAVTWCMHSYEWLASVSPTALITETEYLTQNIKNLNVCKKKF